MTGIDVRGNNFNVDRSEAPNGKAPVIAAVGSLFCSGGAEVGYKVPLTVVRTDKWSPRAPKGVGYSGINLRTGLVIDALGLELTNGERDGFQRCAVSMPTSLLRRSVKHDCCQLI